MKEIGKTTPTNRLLCSLVIAAALTVCTMASGQAAGKGKGNNNSQPDEAAYSLEYEYENGHCDIYVQSTDKAIGNVTDADGVRFTPTEEEAHYFLLGAFEDWAGQYIYIKAGNNGGKGVRRNNGTGDLDIMVPSHLPEICPAIPDLVIVAIGDWFDHIQALGDTEMALSPFTDGFDYVSQPFSNSAIGFDRSYLDGNTFFAYPSNKVLVEITALDPSLEEPIKAAIEAEAVARQIDIVAM